MLSLGHTRKQAVKHTWLILGLALALRVLAIFFVLRHHAHGWFFARGTEMSFMAKAILEGHGLSSPFGVETGPTAMFAPLYPILEALVFRVSGSYTTSSAVMLMAIHVVANLVTLWWVMSISRRYFGERVAVVSGLIWAASLPLWFVPTILWDTSITICLLTGLVALALRVQRKHGRWSWIALGAFCALTALFNPALTLTIFGIVAVTVFGAWRRDRVRWKHVALSGLIFCLLFSAWPIRNARVLHAFVPLRTALGLDVWMGNHEGASGYLQENLFPTFNPAELAAYRQQGEVAYTEGKMKLASAWIRQHPGQFLGLTARRMGRFWAGTGTAGGPAIFALHAVLTSLLGCWGLALLLRRSRELALLFATPLLLFPLPYYVSHAEFRFRLVIDPLLALLAGYALVHLFDRQTKPTVP